MLPKNVLVALLGAAVAVEASFLNYDSAPAKTLARRQRNRGGGRFGGNRNGGGNNRGNGGGNNNNQQQQQQQGQGQQQQGQGQQQQGQGQQQQDQGQQQQGQDQQQQNQGQANNAQAQDSALCLDPNNVQTGSQQDGQQAGNLEAGQSPSQTDDANFINFCGGKTLTNGEQVEAGSCNGVVMGDIPAKNKMISTVILNPPSGGTIPANQDFDIEVFTTNLDAGSFTQPQLTYYAAPQTVNGNGIIIGHTHVTVQDLGSSENPQSPPDPTQFVFFKGINDAGDGNGRLKASVPGGLPAGIYRVCTMTGASNHQPVLMPVAQRGAQDDCLRFEVTNGGGGNGGGNGGNNNNNSGSNAGNGNGNNANDGGNQNNGNQGQNQGNNGNQGQNQGDNGNQGQNQENNGNQGQNQGNNGNQGQNQGNNGNNNNGGGNGGGQGGASAADALGGIAAPEVTDSGNSKRPFEVNGNTFVNKSAAVERACSIQNNACADAVNGKKIQGATVSDCGSQISKCVSDLS